VLSAPARPASTLLKPSPNDLLYLIGHRLSSFYATGFELSVKFLIDDDLPENLAFREPIVLSLALHGYH
jgi:hypothetical protein